MLLIATLACSFRSTPLKITPCSPMSSACLTTHASPDFRSTSTVRFETPPARTVTRGSSSGPTNPLSRRYAVNALGFAGNLSLPTRGVGLGLKYYKEFSNRSTFEGYSLQITGSVAF